MLSRPLQIITFKKGPGGRHRKKANLNYYSQTPPLPSLGAHIHFQRIFSFFYLFYQVFLNPIVVSQQKLALEKYGSFIHPFMLSKEVFLLINDNLNPTQTCSCTCNSSVTALPVENLMEKLDQQNLTSHILKALKLLLSYNFSD